MTVITIYALFADDARTLLMDKDTDWIFWAMSLFALVLYCLEIVITAFVKVRRCQNGRSCLIDENA
jgi:uncharacterized membrane protein (DUF485 family)